MRLGERLDFASLKLLRKSWREVKYRNRIEATVWDYEFFGPDHVTYLYSGSFKNIEPGHVVNATATVAWIGKGQTHVRLKRPRFTVPALAQSDLFG